MLCWYSLLHWKSSYSSKVYHYIKPCLCQAVIICQSVARRHLTSKMFGLLQQKRVCVAATSIQSEWRSYALARDFHATKCKVVISQSIIRRFIAERYLGHLLSGKHTHSCSVLFVLILTDFVCVSEMILSQAIVRSNSSSEAATKISSQWRGYKCLVVYIQVKKGVPAIILLMPAESIHRV